MSDTTSPKGQIVKVHTSAEHDEKIRDIDGNRLYPAQQMSEEEFAAAEKSLKRKLDLRLTAMVWLIFVLNYLDRVCLQTSPEPWSNSICV